ncbi:hypothetical protein ACVMB2_003781 [Sinorhizobium meliloti]
MYEPFVAQIKAWLKEEPTLSAAGVLRRLTEIDPIRFTEKNIRMVQMLVKLGAWKWPGWSSWMEVGSRACHLPPRPRLIRARRRRQCSVTFLGEAIGGVNSSIRLTLGAEPSGVGGDGLQCLSRDPHQQCIHDRLVLKSDLGDSRRPGEDHVEEWDRQQISDTSRNPLLARRTLALRTVAIAAGVVGDTG